MSDSVFSNKNFGLLEQEAQKSITAVKADGFDNVENNYTVNHFLDVIDCELSRN